MFGSMLVQYAIMWYLTLETGSGVVLTLSIVFGMLPQAIVSIFGGVWADRLNRRVLIVAADASIAATTLVLAIVMLSGYKELWLIYLALAIRSTGAGIQQPAVMALIPQIVPTEHLMRVNGLFQTISSGIMLVAPAVGAAIYAVASIEAIFFIDVVTAIIGILLLLTIKVPTLRAPDDRKGYFTDLVLGLKYTRAHRFALWLIAIYAIMMILGAAPSYLTPLFVAREFGEDIWLLAINELSFSIGMLAAGATVATWGGMRNRVLMIVLACLVFGVLNIGLGLSPVAWLFFVFMFCSGATIPFMATPSMTLLQERVEPEFHGRVFGLVNVAMTMGMPIGMMLFGPLADVVDLVWLFLAAGMLSFIAIVVAVGVPAGREALRTGADRPAAATEQAAV